MSPTCARPGCDNDVVRVPGRRGRPPIYCSPACRASLTVSGDRSRVVVEVEQLATGDEDRPLTGRDWMVRVRRGRRSAIVARDLGRFSATSLAGELRAVIEPAGRRSRTIE